jgi:hypothetical protein
MRHRSRLNRRHGRLGPLCVRRSQHTELGGRGGHGRDAEEAVAVDFLRGNVHGRSLAVPCAAVVPSPLPSGKVGEGVFKHLAALARLQAEELFRDEFAPLASPHLCLRKPAYLHRQTLIHFEWFRVDRETPIGRRWLAQAGMHHFAPKAELTFTEAHAIPAAIAGQGVGLLDLMLIADELQAGR